MANLLMRWCVITAGICVASHLLPGFTVSSVSMMIIGAAVLGLLNVTLRPLLLLLTLPLNLLTLGLFTLVINGLIIYITGGLIKGWHIGSFWTALGASLIISVISLVANAVLRFDR
ncbi:MAG TPA: phage holin family protein [Spirochaetota bacterium]|nr:phage holin family protein [Spirochaetota bacterium]